MRCTAIAATFLACSLAIPTPAVAQTAADRETARSLMEQGHDLYDKKDFKEALKRFKAANDIMHVPSTALWTAKAQTQLGLLVEARDTIAAMRRMPEQPNDPKPFKDARNEAIKLDDQLASRVGALTIVLKGAPPGDSPTVTIDDVQVPSTVVGLPRSVDAGHHVVAIKSATAQGQAEVDVKEGEQKQLEVSLDAIAVPAPPPTEQPAPAQPEEPPPPVRSHSPTALTWIGIGLAGAGAIAGGVTGFMSMQKTSTVKNDCPNSRCGPNDYATLDSANTLAIVSDIGFGVAGAGAILAVVTLLVGHDVAPEGAAPAEEAPSPAAAPSDQQQQSRVNVVPWIGLGTAGVTGTF